MIHEIHQNDYYKVKMLLEGVRNFPEVHAVIDQNNPGKIYTDNRNAPQTALVWSQGMQGFYFIGDDKNDSFLKDIKEFINQVIIRDLIQKEINWFEISGANTRWDHRIEELFEERDIQYGIQLTYLWNKSTDEYKHQLNCYDIRKVDQDILGLEVENLDFIIKELELFWGTLSNFFKNGICYYTIEDNKIVSICYSGFKTDNTFTIGIETLKEYRKKGYAHILASHFIQDCLEHAILPYWDCSDDNIASRKLAEKLGFEKDSQYRCYWFNF
ncbi:GNAT family N-acetyltransferase [Vallitalea okinawensis]|uniref:GNAT family N-acetyltransferase n=1 Tax=Vallitalea okinawensis TaxID=2078660 RepID=UPI000CFBA59B|nr:GNAT family N-acetyltransferase [Vallitalea okinawensis]